MSAFKDSKYWHRILGNKGEPRNRTLFLNAGYVCEKCGAKHQLTRDHAVPKSKGGENTKQNLQVLCKPCNEEKRDAIEVYTTRKAVRKYVRRFICS